ncbi:FAD-binding protein [Bacteriovorax sp. PP10]|uniref:UDP-N-acetylenolpyruvoylglucosamine reductase n=1 Tax=Bacteriovorax antarcticus TaxID=3088717 RepID=A0ABU5VQ43_9BACT|nr:FAD-binding protein [Bacteriovorax sp. PP10]MEA9354722.1 FAD-binding protein [Bacteriovorax sp. PP10]
MLANIINHPDVQIEIDKDLKKYSTMRLDARGDLITVKSVEGLKHTLKALTKNNIEYRALGWGANVLLPVKADLPYLQLDFEFDRSVFESPKDEYILPGSVSLATLTSHANKFGLKGWEVFTGIPASLGGAIFMNAGTNLGEIGSIIKEVKLITKNGEEKSVIIDKNSFSYRHNHFVDSGDIIYEARLIHFGLDEAISKKIREYLDMRNRTQPLKEWTCGCIFKNHHDRLRDVTCRAGLFIDIMGLKGLTIKNLKISPKHANFMENSGESSYEDVMQMITVLQKELKLQFGVSFETEVEF